MTIHQWTPKKLKQSLDEKQSLILLDVREANEFAYAHIPGSIHIHLLELPNDYDKLNPVQTIVVICHHGIRSQKACLFLENAGDFAMLCNLQGGIDAWSVECDSSIKRY